MPSVGYFTFLDTFSGILTRDPGVVGSKLLVSAIITTPVVTKFRFHVSRPANLVQKISNFINRDVRSVHYVFRGEPVQPFDQL